MLDAVCQDRVLFVPRSYAKCLAFLPGANWRGAVAGVLTSTFRHSAHTLPDFHVLSAAGGVAEAASCQLASV